jgi:hypothetical protein
MNLVRRCRVLPSGSVGLFKDEPDVQYQMGVFSRQNYSGVMFAGMLACSVVFTSRNICASVAAPRDAAPSLPQRSADDWSATILSDPAMKPVDMSPSTTSLVPAGPGEFESTSLSTANRETTALPMTVREAPAAIPVAPAAPIGGLTLLAFAIPILANRRIRRWLLR